MKNHFEIKKLLGTTQHGSVGELDPINLKINENAIVSFLSGKRASLFFRLIMGRGEIDQGEITLNGIKRSEVKKELWLRSIGLAFRDRGLLSNQTIFDNVALPWKYHSEDLEQFLDPKEALTKSYVDEQFWHKRPHEVPWKVRKWALLARSIILRPKLLLLDDPTNLIPFDELGLLRKWILDRKDEGSIVFFGSDNHYFAYSINDYNFKFESSQLIEPINENENVQKIIKLSQQMKGFFKERE